MTSTPSTEHVTHYQPNWLAKLTPTGCARWYPPLRSAPAPLTLVGSHRIHMRSIHSSHSP